MEPKEHIVPDGMDPIWQRDAYLLADWARNTFMFPVLLVLFLLLFFEAPMWCRPSSLPTWTMASEPCKAPDLSSQIYLSGIPYLPPGVQVAIEIACYACILSILWLEQRWRGISRFVSSPLLMCYVVLAVAGVGDAISFATIPNLAFRASPYIRLMLLAVTEPLRTALRSSAEMVFPYLRILVVLVGLYVLVAFVFSLDLAMDDDVVPQCAAIKRREAPNLLVPSTSDNEQAGGLPAQLEPVHRRFVSPPPFPPPSPMPPNYFGVPTVVDFPNPTVNNFLGSGPQLKNVYRDGRPILQMITSATDPCPSGSDGFSNLMDAIFSFVFIASNQELPDLLIPSYSTYRPFGAVWLLIFVVINFIVLSVVLATVFSEYKKTFERNTVRRFKNRALCLFEAYDELVAEQTSNGRSYVPADTSAAAAAVTGVTEEQFNSLFAELNRSVTVRYVTPTHLRYLFDTLDDDSNGLLDRNEFVDLVDALNFKYSSVRKQSYAERKMPWLWTALCGASLKAWAVSRSWLSLRVFMIAVMLLNTAAIITETVMDQYYWAEHERFFWTFAWLYFSFSMFYLAEIAIELLTQPWYPYFVLEHRLLELCISLGVSVISILWVLPFVNVPAAWMRYANILRVLKLAEVLYQLSDDFQFVFTSLLAIGRGSITVLCQLFLWTSLFVVVSVQLFGGAVYETNPRLRGMDYAESYEEVLNFNDFAMGFLPFVVTLVGGGPDQSLILGIGAAADRPIASKVVFLAYYYTGHLIFLNVFISFVLNGYELHVDARGIYKDGLDALQQEQLKSLEDSLKDADPDWEVKVGSTQGEDVLLRRMFADAVQEAVSEASYHQLQSPVGSRAQRQRAVSNANRKTVRKSVPFSRPGTASRRSGPASATPAMQSPYAREMHL